jgi:hypothetical protein
VIITTVKVTFPVFVAVIVKWRISPTVAKFVSAAVLTRVMAGAWTAVTVAWAVLEVTPPPLAVAIFVTDPVSRSAWVIV